MIERWVIVALVVALVSGLYHVCTKLAAGKIPDVTGGVILEITAVAAMGLYLLLMRRPFWGTGVTQTGVLFSIAGGVCVAFATVLGFAVYRLHGPLSAAGPLILVGALVVMVVVGRLFLGETLTVSRSLGLGLAAASIWLLTR
ncbi:MAG TPA: hypothetical protein VM118_14615 [Acidobacteriota bacterium]|nr:hypothetical protein [Acidobacteriota bacterium]